jgi:AcrR family transcriptional regulator
MQKTDDPFLRFFRRAPKQARSRALVGAVISAFEEQLANNESLGPLRLEQLIERAGVGIGSFYEYFSNKDSLVGVLIGQVTERNFQALLAPLDHEFASVEAFANEFALHVARTFLEKPYTTRMAIDGIGRFGLLRTIVLERDRFVGHLTPRVQPFFPTVPAEELHTDLVMIADCALGRLASALMREKSPAVEPVAKELAALALAYLSRPRSKA